MIASSEDPAARNIYDNLLKYFYFDKSTHDPDLYVFDDVGLIQISGEVTEMDNLPLDFDEVIVASRHVSESGRPCLTTHVPGEPNEKKLAVAAPFTLKSALCELDRLNDEYKLGLDVSLEATHHGPVHLDVPVTFVEIGSSLEQWRDSKVGEVVAMAIMSAIKSSDFGMSAIGLGGSHYARKHTRLALESDLGIGHIFPNYQSLDIPLLEEALKRTMGEPVFALDYNGMDHDTREYIQEIACKLDIEVYRDQDILRRKKA